MTFYDSYWFRSGMCFYFICPSTLVQRPRQHLADCHAACWPFTQHPHGSQPPLDLQSAPELHIPATTYCISKTFAAHSHAPLTVNPHNLIDLPDLSFLLHHHTKDFTSTLEISCSHYIYILHINMLIFLIGGMFFHFHLFHPQDKFQLCTQDISWPHC